MTESPSCSRLKREQAHAPLLFDLRDERGLLLDEEGLLLSDMEAVQDEAARSLGGFAHDEARSAKLDGGFVRGLTIEVRDEEGPVMRARFYFEISVSSKLPVIGRLADLTTPGARSAAAGKADFQIVGPSELYIWK